MYDDEIKAEKERLARARDLGKRDWEAGSLGALGNIYADAGDIDKAIACHEQALEIRQRMGYSKLAAISYRNLAAIYDLKLDNLPRAIECLERAAELDPDNDFSAKRLAGLRRKLMDERRNG
jgi:tetratricopeptide (TPR) repeat protein